MRLSLSRVGTSSSQACLVFGDCAFKRPKQRAMQARLALRSLSKWREVSPAMCKDLAAMSEQLLPVCMGMNRALQPRANQPGAMY